MANEIPLWFFQGDYPVKAYRLYVDAPDGPGPYPLPSGASVTFECWDPDTGAARFSHPAQIDVDGTDPEDAYSRILVAFAVNDFDEVGGFWYRIRVLYAGKLETVMQGPLSVRAGPAP